MSTTKATSVRRWHRAAGIALAGLMAFATGGAMAQNLVKNGDFTSYVAPLFVKNPDTGLPYTSFITRDLAGATNIGGYLNDWTVTSYLSGGALQTNFGPASQLITGNDNDALFKRLVIPETAPYNNPNTTCCLLAWSHNNVRTEYGTDGAPTYTLPPDQVNNNWDGRGPNGANYWMTDAKWNAMSLSQSVTGLQAGKQYTLDFKWAAGQLVYTSAGGATAGWNVLVGNNSFTTGTLSINPEEFSGWQDASYTFTATAASATLTFQPIGSGSPPMAMLSGISVTAVPEPETLLMLGLGLAVLTVVRRRTR